MATATPYNLNWATGVEKMLIVSVGTGTSPQANADLNANELNLLYNATTIPSALMFAALNEQDLLCRVFGDCLVGDPIDREVGDLIGVVSKGIPKLFTYLRYNAELTEEGLGKLGVGDIQPEHVQALDSVDYIGELKQVGEAVANKRVDAKHFSRF
jgi:hypothetical protein